MTRKDYFALSEDELFERFFDLYKDDPFYRDSSSIEQRREQEHENFERMVGEQLSLENDPVDTILYASDFGFERDYLESLSEETLRSLYYKAGMVELLFELGCDLDSIDGNAREDDNFKFFEKLHRENEIDRKTIEEDVDNPDVCYERMDMTRAEK